MKINHFIILILMLVACERAVKTEQAEIEWNSAPGDFSFTNNWSYPEGVYVNDFGQLSCDGFCPPETDAMKDSTGRIYEDSLTAFYTLVDTVRRFYSMQSEASCDEFDRADYMIAGYRGDTVVCYSLCNAATHCSLHLKIIHNTCFATVQLHSITGRDTVYVFESGYFKADPELWKAGILKAAFSMNFGTDKRSGKKICWQGLIHTPIRNAVY